MSVRLGMLHQARRAPQLLGESSARVVAFLRSQQSDDGGFMNRAGKSDLYYTVFGIDALLALQAPFSAERSARYLAGFDDGHRLDLVHLSCLARCWAGLEQAGICIPLKTAHALIAHIERHRTAQGYAPDPGSPATAYAGFLAWSAYEDLRQPLPRRTALLRGLARLQTPDGAFSNKPDAGQGSTNATAAAIVVARSLHLPLPASLPKWLLARCYPAGGFLASPDAPMPDLLSTATALHALGLLGTPVESIKEKCISFIDSLWSNCGAFHGSWADDQVDCEYTFYGLLALGNLV